MRVDLTFDNHTPIIHFLQQPARVATAKALLKTLSLGRL
jgi:hypothetical protein